MVAGEPTRQTSIQCLEARGSSAESISDLSQVTFCFGDNTTRHALVRLPVGIGGPAWSTISVQVIEGDASLLARPISAGTPDRSLHILGYVELDLPPICRLCELLESAGSKGELPPADVCHRP